MQQFQQLIPCFRRSKVTFTRGFKSLPILVRLTSPRARTITATTTTTIIVIIITYFS